MEISKDGPNGLGGWLILPLLGLLLSPVIKGMSLVNDAWPILQDPYWSALTTPGSTAYHKLWAPLLISEVTVNIFLLLFGLYLLYLMFVKSKKLPDLIIVFYVLHLLFVVVDHQVMNMIPAVAEQNAQVSFGGAMLQEILIVLIWVPYFIKSKRVKNTFVM